MEYDDCQILVEDLHKKFGQLEVLKGVNLNVRRGEVVVIMGPSGSGKTTFIRCINFLEVPDAGRVQVCGLAIPCAKQLGMREQKRRIRQIRQKAGMVFQQFNLFPHMTVLENVIEGPIGVRGMSRTDAITLGKRLLDRVGLAAKCDVYPSRLSGGQKQRVAIARALAMEPEVVLFDEPTSALDPELHEEVLQTMRLLARDGMTMVVVTHEIAFAQDVADKVVFMDGGHVLEEASAKDFFVRPQHQRARSFLRLMDHNHLQTAEEPVPQLPEV